MDSAIVPATETPPISRPTAIETYELSKNYRTGFWLTQKVASLKGCTLQVFQGETFGLLGPNGAGKTTLLKMLLGITRATSGRALVLGKPTGDRTVKQRIGYLPENPYFYDYLTGWEILSFTAGLFGIPRFVQQKRIPELLDMVGLAQTAAKRKQLRQYSKGMLQRVGLAQALINDPELVFLDEPMSGLDPLGRYQIREIILSLKQQGKTIFFNSHILADVEMICDRVAILGQGELLCIGSLQELLGTSDAYRAKVKGGNPDVLKNRLANLEFKDNYWQGNVLGSTQDFLASLNIMGAQLIEMHLARPTLEEFFVLQLQAKGIRYSA
ncbi:MAG: ABC transporter ATP-binding protein [Oscillatoriales cyanobacterium C42_A2020_001]|nr:ABC transporter ATP-binding protein [Leptolyngbyaceae cyanobacterium C42_A2020_001]